MYGFKMTDMRDQHLNEPVFDNINENMLLADEYCFTRIDLNTVKIEELGFASKFENKIVFDGQLNGFVIWFEVGFSPSHEGVWLDGSPYAEKRVFSQIVVYLKNTVEVRKGDTVRGDIVYSNDSEDRYKVNLQLSVNLEGSKYKNVQYYAIE